MGLVLLMVLIFGVVLGLFALFTNYYASFWYTLLVNKRLETINYLMMTDEVPPRWRVLFLETLAKKNAQSSFWKKIHRLLYQWYIYRLGLLENKIKHMSMIKKDEKFQFLEAIKEIRAEWKSYAESL